MCRVPKVLLVAPDDVQHALRRTLSSIDYDIVAVVRSLDDARDIACDAVVLYEPDESIVVSARDRGIKTVALGGSGGADLDLATDDAAALRSRLWELFRPS